MDGRKWLPVGTELDFPGMACVIDDYIGRGSNALVYKGYYEDAQTRGQVHHVLVKELFPLDRGQAIYRDENGRIVVGEESAALYRIHKVSFERGNQMHLKFLSANPAFVGGNLNTFEMNGTYYTILGISGGQTLERIQEGFLKGQPADARPAALKSGPALTLERIVNWMLGLLDALEIFHQEGCLHMDISPDNILVVPRGRQEHILLIDYNTVGTVAEWKSGTLPFSSIKEGYTAPEIRGSYIGQAGFGADLYSVAAVFYRCLFGHVLEVEDLVLAKPPAAREAPMLQGQPETVIQMTEKIMKMGLASLPLRRYRNTARMRTDFEELLDRIHCVGVTHWALWEKERERLFGLVRKNPAYAFLLKEECFPIAVRLEEGQADAFAFRPRETDSADCRDCTCESEIRPSLSQEALLHALKEAPAFMGQLKAPGGMGKTTALLSLALRQNKTYHPGEPVAVFLSAADYRPQESWFVHDRILERMKFRPETKDYQTARHELDQLFSRPLPAKGRPSVILLIDGMNEPSCVLDLLYREIEDLARLPGVSVLVSSRGEIPLPCTDRLKLEPLNKKDVVQVLSQRGLLYPKDETVQELLSVPLLLSMFIRTAKGSGRQPDVSGKEALMEAMIRMEVDRFQEEAPLHWQADAALYAVLPAIADAQCRRSSALKEEEVLRVVRRCRRMLRAPYTRRVFPRWTGREKDIFQGAKTAEEWYGMVVLGYLWRQSGMLVKEDGRFRVFHPLFAEWLAGLYRKSARRVSRIRHIRYAVAAGAVSAALFSGYLALKPYFRTRIVIPQAEYYPRDAAKEVLQAASDAYGGAASNCSLVLQAIEYAKCRGLAEDWDEDWFEYLYTGCCPSASVLRLETVNAASALDGLMDSAPEGALMPWSGKTFPRRSYEGLVALPEEMAESHVRYLDILKAFWEDEAYFAAFGEEYLADFQAAVEADLDVLSWYYCNVIKPELAAMGEKDAELYELLTTSSSLSMDRQIDETAILEISYARIRREAWKVLEASAPSQMVTGDDSVLNIAEISDNE